MLRLIRIRMGRRGKIGEWYRGIRAREGVGMRRTLWVVAGGFSFFSFFLPLPRRNVADCSLSVHHRANERRTVLRGTSPAHPPSPSFPSPRCVLRRFQPFCTRHTAHFHLP